MIGNPIVRHHLVVTLVPMLLGLLFASCSSSKSETAQAVDGSGIISGKVEQVLHHGAHNPNGPNKTITPLGGIGIIVADTTGAAIDTLLSNDDGGFAGNLPSGVYVLTAPPQKNEVVPGDTPPPERITLRAGETRTVVLQYQVYAP